MFVLVVIVAITYSIFFLLPGGNTDTIAQRFAGKAPQPEVVTGGSVGNLSNGYAANQTDVLGASC